MTGGCTMDEQNREETPEDTNNEQTPASPLLGTPREILSRYSHCAVCGGNLHFTHLTDFSRNLTQEIAKCPECGIRARNVLHRLQ